MTTLALLETAVDNLTTQATASFDASVALQGSISSEIAAAVTDADENVIIPVMAMYTNQVAMAVSLANINTSFITLITPEA
jgi:hypothetical protein